MLSNWAIVLLRGISNQDSHSTYAVDELARIARNVGYDDKLLSTIDSLRRDSEAILCHVRNHGNVPMELVNRLAHDTRFLAHTLRNGVPRLYTIPIAYLSDLRDDSGKVILPSLPIILLPDR